MEILLDTSKRDKKAYELAFKFLVNCDGRVTKKIIEHHLSESEYNFPDNMTLIFRRIIESTKNAQMKSRVIGDLKNIEEKLCGYDHTYLLRRYNGDWKQLLDSIVKTNKIKRLEDKSIWPRYCRSIVSSAMFLSRFKTAKEFHEFARVFYDNDITLPALPLIISKEIYGIGFPLACDFLKEIGYQKYAKPDVHLRKILPDLNLSDSRDEYVVFKSVVRIAENVNATPFAVDKIFWLIGSGKFHKSGFEIGRRADEFIGWAKPQLDQIL